MTSELYKNLTATHTVDKLLDVKRFLLARLAGLFRGR